MGMRKRVSRACDECRLHKARCDGISPCETCQRYDRVCSYDLLPFECKGSAARIRILENRLLKANEHITRLKQQAPPARNVSVIQSSPSSSDSEVIKKVLFLRPETPPDTSNKFIVSLLRPLSCHAEIKALAESQSARSLLQDRNVRRNTSTGFCQLPAYDIALEHIYTAFNDTFGLCSIVVEQNFRIATQRLYDLKPISYTQEDIGFMPLFHAVLALGMIYTSPAHLGSGHDSAVQESFFYFEAAAFTVLSNDECSTIPKLQIRLCLVLYYLGTSRLNLARPMLQVICTSSIVHTLLQSVTRNVDVSESRAKDIIWIIFYIDMHISSLTHTPALLEAPGPEIATVYAINSAAYNVANYKRSSSTFLLSVSLAMAIELIKLIRRIFPAKPLTKPRSHRVLSSRPTKMINGNGWSTVTTPWPDNGIGQNRPQGDISVAPIDQDVIRTELQTWDYMFHNIFPENEGNMQISLAGSELRLHYCLAEIMLYHTFLECLAESTATGQNYEIDEINKGIACVAAATNAISHISTRLAQIPAANLTWSSAYTIFVSSLTLLVAAAFAHADERHVIHGTVYVAIQILQDTTYGSIHCKKSYLGFIQALAERVMMPFDFAPLYQSPSSVKTSATSRSAATDRTTSWCDSSPQDAPDLSRLRLWPTETRGGVPDDWGFDEERCVE